jgi:hypothetical protein
MGKESSMFNSATGINNVPVKKFTGMENLHTSKPIKPDFQAGFSGLKFKQNSGQLWNREAFSKQADPAVINQATEQLQGIYNKEFSVREKLETTSQNSTEAAQLRKTIENITASKVNLVNTIAEEFPPGSPNSNTLKSTGKLLQEQLKTDMIDYNLKGIRESRMNLENSLNGLDPASTDAKSIENQLLNLSQVENALKNKKTESNKGQKKLNNEIRNLLPNCTPEVRSIISDIKSNEAQSDQKAIDSNEEKQQTIAGKLDELQQAKQGLMTNLNSSNPDSADSQMIQSRLEAINNIEKGLLMELKKTFSEGSKQEKAVDSMLRLNDLEMERNMMTSTLDKINIARAQLTDHLQHVDSESSAASDIQSRLQQLDMQQEKINDGSRDSSKDISKEKAKLKRNILGAPTDDKKLLAEVRSDHLRTHNEVRSSKINNLETQMDAVTNVLKSGEVTGDDAVKYENHLDMLKKSYQAERRTLKVDKDEEQFWNVIERIPAQSMNNSYQIRA